MTTGIGSGISGQIGYGAESTVGTGVTPTRFFPLISENIQDKRPRMESDAIIANRIVDDAAQWAAGNIMIAGPVQHRLYDHSMVLLMKHLFGTYGVTGAGPYTHTVSPGSTTGLGLTTQVGRPDSTGTIQPFTFSGGKISKGEIGLKSGQIATLGLDMLFMNMTTATALAAPSYAAALNPIHFLQMSVLVAGAVTMKTHSAKLSFDSKLAERRFNGQATTDEPLREQQMEITGDLEPEFIGLTEYNRFVNANQFAIVVTLTSGSNSYTFTYNARYDGDAANLASTKILNQPLKFKAIGSTDAAACTLVCVNQDAAA